MDDMKMRMDMNSFEYTIRITEEIIRFDAMDLKHVKKNMEKN